MSSALESGNHLRDAISNKKIMSYKLMSKVPGAPGSSTPAAGKMLEGNSPDFRRDLVKSAGLGKGKSSLSQSRDE